MQVFRWVEPKRQIDWRFRLTRIFPVGLFMALTLHFGNVVYLYLTVSFIQMLKARVHSSVTRGSIVFESDPLQLPVSTELVSQRQEQIRDKP